MKIFVPIKKESQRVPGKNTRKLNGNPLYIHTLERFSDFDIYVDTDDPVVYEELRDWINVTVYMRAEPLCGNDVSVNELINYFLWISKPKLKEVVAQIHVTSPFLEPDTLLTAESFMENKWYSSDSILGSTIIRSRLWKHNGDVCIPVNHNPLVLQPTQDLEPIYVDNSSFYVFTYYSFYETKSRVGKTPCFYEIGFPENLDIDTEEDWKLAEMIAESLAK